MPASAAEFIALYQDSLADHLRQILNGTPHADALQLLRDEILHHWWGQALTDDEQPLSPTEHAFWYTLALLESTPLHELRGNRFLRQRLHTCLALLMQQSTSAGVFIRGTRP